MSVFFKQSKGFTLFELLVVVSALTVVTTIVFKAMNPRTQFAKGRDAVRKADLQKLRNPLEEYYNDKKCYPNQATMNCNPGDGLRPYWSKIPCDPSTHASYYYERPDCKTYRLYATLENETDPDIAAVGCSGGCIPGKPYNYGVSSTNTKLKQY